jgi:hypothetical protein
MRKRHGIVAAVVGAAVLALPQQARAAACGRFVEVVPDGRLLTDTVDATQDVRITFRAVPGRSYSIEIVQVDFLDTVSVLVGPANNPCPIADVAGLNDTPGADPVVDALTVRRASFTESTGGAPFHVLRVTSSTTSPITYSVSDTTMFSPAWTTNGTYDTYWSFQNTTRLAVNTVLTLRDPAGVVVQNVPFMIPALGIFGTNTASLLVPRNKVGNATLTHDGPPASVLIKANQANFASSPPFIELVPFEAVRQIR